MTADGPQARTVLIADDHLVVAEGLALALKPYFNVIGVVHELDLLIATIKQTRPHVVLLDITFDGVNSLPVIRRAIDRGQIATRFVVLTAHESIALRQAAFNAGAHGFLLKGVGTQELRVAIDTALADRQYGADWKQRGTNPIARRGENKVAVTVDGFQLHVRQVRALLLFRRGLSRQQVAEKMGITLRGVDFHLSTAREVTGIRRTQLLLQWVAEQREALEAALRKKGVRE